jgi:hypothetical protein
MRIRSYRGDDTNGHYIDAYNKTNGVLIENWVMGVGTYYETLGIASNQDPRILNQPRLGYGSDGTYVGWEAVEVYIKVGLAGESIHRCWRNGVLWFEDTLNATAQDSGGFIKSAGLFGHYSNVANEAGSPKDQSLWVDDVVITNERPSGIDAHGNPYIGVGDVVTFDVDGGLMTEDAGLVSVDAGLANSDSDGGETPAEKPRTSSMDGPAASTDSTAHLNGGCAIASPTHSQPTTLLACLGVCFALLAVTRSSRKSRS